MDCPMCGWMGMGMALAALLGLALLVLAVLGIIRLWPRGAAPFSASEPSDRNEPDGAPDGRSGPP